MYYDQNTKPRDLAERLSQLPRETETGNLHFLALQATQPAVLTEVSHARVTHSESDLPVLLSSTGMCIYPGVFVAPLAVSGLSARH